MPWPDAYNVDFGLMKHQRILNLAVNFDAIIVFIYYITEILNAMKISRQNLLSFDNEYTAYMNIELKARLRGQ